MTVIFLFAAALVLYVIIGYPLLLAALARRAASPVRKQFRPSAVTILIPVRNGERWLRAKLESLLAQEYPRELVRIVVISDGSTDQTDAIAGEFSRYGVELLRIPPSGKAAALNAGIERASGQLLILTDVRQPLRPDSLKNMVSCFGDPSVGAVSGHIVFRGSGDDEAPHLGTYWRYEKWIRQNLTRLDSLLVVTGCIFAIRRKIAVPLPEDSLADDAFLPLSVVVRGYRVVHEPGAVAYEVPTALETDFSRKVRTLAGLYQLLRDHPRLLGPANRLWFHFWSYKLGRLALPFALLSLAAASFGLPHGSRPYAVGAQALFYGLALVHPLIPRGWPVSRLSSMARTFVVLMAASFCAVSVLFVPAGRLWKEWRVEPAGKSKAASGRG